MNNWEKLEELVRQGQFELVLGPEDPHDPVPGAVRPDRDLRLIYLMNDAVESFLVFRNAVMRGQYLQEFEGEIRVERGGADASSHGQSGAADIARRNFIVLHQEENVVTIFFDELDFVYDLFDYSQVGHFWVKGYEYLRQLEFKIAILRDKLTYIGADACTETERKLAALAGFPPLGYGCYPAVPAQYIVPRADCWVLTEEAAAVMREVAIQAKDTSYLRWLYWYRKLPTRWMAKLLAGKLHQTRHIPMTRTLMEWFEAGCGPYPLRYTVAEDHPAFQGLKERIQRAETARQALQDAGKPADIFIEEPFLYARDGVAGTVFLAQWHYGRRSTRLETREIR